MRILLFAFLFLFGLSAYSQSELVFSLEGTFVTRVPERNLKLFKKDELIHIEKLHYVINPFAKKLISYLNEAGIKIHIISGEAANVAPAVVKELNINTNTLLQSATADLKLVSADISNLLLVGDTHTVLAAEQSELFINLGSYFYAYPSFKSASENNTDANQARFFPKNEDEWFIERNKLALIPIYLEKKDLSGDKKELINEGMARLKAGFKAARYRWLTDDRKNVIGCEDLDKKKQVGIEVCQKTFPSELKLVEAEGDSYSCLWVTKDQQKLIVKTEDNLRTCFTEKQGVKFYWFKGSRYSCLAFLKTKPIGSVEGKECSDKVIIFHPETKKPYYFKTFPGFEKLSEEELLKKFVNPLEEQGAICLKVEEGLDKTCARFKAHDSVCHDYYSEDSVAWDRASCINFNGDEVIAEVVNLDDNAIIPAAIYKKYNSIRIAKSIVHRSFQKFARKGISKEDVLKPSYDVYHEAQPVMAFNYSKLQAIVDKGFLNQHITGQSNGCACTDRRAGIEDGLAGLSLESSYGAVGPAAHMLRPKYSFAEFLAPNDSLSNAFMHHYGDVLAVFKSEVKQRAFITPGDSLNRTYSLRNAMTYFASYKNFSFSRQENYYETQIWGELSFKDVNYLIVNCFSNTSRQVIDILKFLNLKTPVYQCRVTRNNNSTFEQGELLYGDPAQP